MNEFKERYEKWTKEELLDEFKEMIIIFNKFDEFIKLKYGDDYLDGWLYYLRNGEIKHEESH